MAISVSINPSHALGKETRSAGCLLLRRGCINWGWAETFSGVSQALWRKRPVDLTVNFWKLCESWVFFPCAPSTTLDSSFLIGSISSHYLRTAPSQSGSSWHSGNSIHSDILGLQLQSCSWSLAKKKKKKSASELSSLLPVSRAQLQ